MVKNKQGTTISISSTAGLDRSPGKSAYGASKAAIVAMTKSISHELGEHGIRANCIAPGVIDTDMLDTMPEYVVEGAIKDTCLKRVGGVSDIVKTALFLASDLSSCVSGQVLRVDGGTE